MTDRLSFDWEATTTTTTTTTTNNTLPYFIKTTKANVLSLSLSLSLYRPGPLITSLVSLSRTEYIRLRQQMQIRVGEQRACELINNLIHLLIKKLNANQIMTQIFVLSRIFNLFATTSSGHFILRDKFICLPILFIILFKFTFFNIIDKLK